MPELPEVETVRRGLAEVLPGKKFTQVDIRDARLVAPRDPLEMGRELTGQVVQSVERRGKYLVVRFVGGRVLLAHLRMTGSFRRGDTGLAADPYVRAVVTLDDGSDVAYRDVRRFGTWLLLEPEDAGAYLAARLGDEPLEKRFTARSLAMRLARRRAAVKAVLLDQRVVAGMGNIYADEALWRARIHPLRPASSLDATEIPRLHRAVRRALALAVERQGSTLRDYRTPDGGAGSMQAEFRVYGRTGEPCPRCGATIEKTRVAGRGTSYCPRCQV